MAETIQRNFRLRLPTITLLEQLEARLNVDQTAIVHLAILEMAERVLPAASRPPAAPWGDRHEGITTLLAHGGTVPEVMDLSGHADPKTLMLYADRLKDSAGKMARMLDEE